MLSHTTLKRSLKALFGLGGLEHDEDFAAVILVRDYDSTAFS